MTTNNDKLFNNPGPLLAELKYSNEPSLKIIVMHYYSLFFSEDEANDLTDQYIKKWKMES